MGLPEYCINECDEDGDTCEGCIHYEGIEPDNDGCEGCTQECKTCSVMVLGLSMASQYEDAHDKAMEDFAEKLFNGN